MQDNKFTRFRFSVPSADLDVLAWAKAQANLSISLRTLIRDSIRAHGVVDATCLPVSTAARDFDPSEPVRPRMRPRQTQVQTQIEMPAAPVETVPVKPVTPAPVPAPVQPAYRPEPVPEPVAKAPNRGLDPRQTQILEDMLQT